MIYTKLRENLNLSVRMPSFRSNKSHIISDGLCCPHRAWFTKPFLLAISFDSNQRPPYLVVHDMNGWWLLPSNPTAGLPVNHRKIKVPIINFYKTISIRSMFKFPPSFVKITSLYKYIADPPTAEVKTSLPPSRSSRHAFRCAGCRGCGGLPGARREVAADLPTESWRVGQPIPPPRGPGHVVNAPHQKLVGLVIGRPYLRETNG